MVLHSTPRNIPTSQMARFGWERAGGEQNMPVEDRSQAVARVALSGTERQRRAGSRMTDFRHGVIHILAALR
jgi:hypothetical protein